MTRVIALAAPGLALAWQAAGDAAPVTIPDTTPGIPDAPVALVEDASFARPPCAAFHDDGLDRLEAEPIAGGRIRFASREVRFERFGLRASMTARCGGGMRLLGLSDMLHEQRRGWIGAGEPATIAASLRAIGRTAGPDGATPDARLSDEAALAEAGQ